MKELPYDTKEAVAALATPWGESALAIIRTAGIGSIEMIGTIFSRPEELLRAENGSMVYGSLRDSESGEMVDQVLAGVFRPPHGYTGEESVELSCHGSLPGIQRILDLLRRIGFRDAAPGEFTLRAFLNGKIDLTRAEAVGEIISAKSKRAQNLALGRLSGNVWRRIQAAKEELIELLAGIELQLDYPEDEIETPPDVDLSALSSVEERLSSLASGYRTGRIFQEGAVVAISGPTNAGKSSLFNLFLREDRSIVSEVHGTTRDYIESWISVRGIPVRLIDTAGLRDAEHPLEREGIRRSAQVTEAASLVLYLVDALEGPSEEERRLFEEKRNDERYIFILNKTDLLENAARAEGWFSLSAVSGEGFPLIEEQIHKRLLGAESGEGELYIDSRRQYELLQRAVGALAHAQRGSFEGEPHDLLAADIREAVDSLGEITGEVSSADILEKIFSNFCVGK